MPGDWPESAEFLNADSTGDNSKKAAGYENGEPASSHSAFRKYVRSLMCERGTQQTYRLNLLFLGDELEYANGDNSHGMIEFLVLGLACAIVLMLWKSRMSYLALGSLAPAQPGAKPDVAIVIPARNEAHQIARVVRSFPKLPVMVVDDGSTDTTSHAPGKQALK